jgi:hypothetical protein
LAAAARCGVTVDFRPPAVGPFRARLSLPGAAGAVELTGAGVAPRLGVDLEALVYGTVTIGGEAERRLTLTNRGDAPLAITRLRVTGAAAADFRLAAAAGGCAGLRRLEPEASCSVTVVFAPRAPGLRQASLEVEHDAEGGRREWPLTGTAVEPPRPQIDVIPAAMRFGEVAVGERGDIRDVTVENPGSGRLVLAGIAVEGAAAGDFRLVPGSCEGAGFVAPQAGCTVGVRFLPTAEGRRSARLVVRHNAAGGRTVVELSGVGRAP